MSTTRPFLVIDLEKAWREDQHPRDKDGKFTKVKGGSRVVTSSGKTGVVKKNTGDKVTIAYDGGGSGTVHRKNVTHEKDHLKAEAEKKKKAKAKQAGKKQSTTKAQNKADGTGKGKAVADPTAKTKKQATATKTAPKTTKTTPTAKKTTTPKATPKKTTAPKATAPKTTTPKATAPKAPPKAKTKDTSEVVTRYGKAPSVQNQPIPQKTNVNRAKDNKEVQSFKEFGTNPLHTTTIDGMWETPEVQKLLKLPPNKRSSEDIQRIAGQITEANKMLAFHVGNKRADMMGFGVIQNRIGNVNAKDPIHQEAGARFELIQSGLGAMYETLHKVLDGSENPRGSIGAHVTSRMKQKITKDLYGLLNSIPAPHDIRQAIGDMKREETNLTQSLGRTPTAEELGKHLMKHSDAFRESAIVKPARWDEGKGTWVATNKQEKDPEARLKALKRYADQQQTASMDKVINGGSGERETTLADTLAVQDTARTPEEAYERKERQQELQGAIPKALREMQLSDTQIELYTLKHSDSSATRDQPYRTDDEVAKLYNERHGTDYGGKWAYKHINAGRQLIAQALKDNHPAIQHLMTMKSFVFTMILKSIFEYDLVKSLHSWGMDHSALDVVHTRTAYGRDVYEVRKSLGPTEYIGSYVTADNGAVRAHIVEYHAPEASELAKSFYAFGQELRKSMFPHKGGTNHAVNEKAQAYVGKNKGKFKQIHSTQQQRIKAKQAGGGKLTWSEELAIKENGFWISWGGKKILISGDEKAFGQVKYDSRNEAHREEHNQGAQEDRVDYHHEKEELDAHRKGIEDRARGEYEGAKGKTGNALRQWANKHNIAWDNEKKTIKLDEAGNLTFDHGEDGHVIDHGITAFNEELSNLHDRYHGEMKAKLREDHGHKATDHYTNMSDEEREAYNSLDAEGKATATGQHLLDKEGVKQRLEQLKGELLNAPKTSHKEIAENALNDLKAMGTGSRVLVNKNLMTGKGASLGGIAKDVMGTDFGSEKDLASLASKIGASELSRSREEVGKNMIPEGKYTIGNPTTGKSLVVSVEHAHEGGRGGKGGQFTSVVKEAFDPSTGEHHTYEGSANSWGTLAKQLGFKNNVKFAEVANKGSDQPLIKEIGEEDFAEARKKTKAGLKDDMLHKEFKKVDEARDQAGNIASRTFAQDMPDGTQNVIEVGNDGYVKDPVMRRLLNQREPIETEDQLHEALTNAVGSTTWMTLHVGSDIHVGDALGHHVKLQYDGKGAPRVVGGTYDGYRYIDSADVPKGSIDPTTGEPVKALFKNGKLVDRRFSTKNSVPMEKGNPVMYPTENGSFRKGRIRDVQDGKFKVVDAKGNLIGMFDQKELRGAVTDGKMNARNSNAVVKLAQKGTHRINTIEAFLPEGKGARAQQRADKAKNLLAEALRKAKVNKAFDSAGNLDKELELSDAQMKRLQKVLGRSKAGRAMLQNFKSAYTSELEIHVPEAMRATVEAEGVTVKKDGTAHISTSKFEQLRDVLSNAGSGLSLEQHARTYLNEHFRMKDRTKQSVEELKKKYQPSALDSGKPVIDEHYRNMYKEDSFLRNPNAGLFSTQLEGVGHLVERKRAIAGHGMGTGKTILGVMASAHYKATQLAMGKKPKKTLIVAPKGIMSDWGKEIGSHTNMKALYVGNFTGAKTSEDGKRIWGQEGTEQQATSSKAFRGNIKQHASEDHDFHIMSYETFAKMRDELTASGMYDNIVIDEIHAFKNKGSNRGKSLAETTDKFKNVWGLSGTPMENDAREVYNLIDSVTGGRHELGSKAEFQEKFMLKDKNGKITGIKPGMENALGDIVANVVQFRHGRDVTKNDGSKIHFPALVGTNSGNENPPMDFIGNMADRSRDHATNEYYGTKHSIADFEEHILKPDGVEGKTVVAYTPKNLDPATKAMYSRYSELQQKYLPESKLKELVQASATGYDRGKQGNSNYLTAMQKLQKYLNAPLAEKMYVGQGGGNAIESDMTNAQGVKAQSEGLKPYNPETGEGHYIVDKDGHKRYFESDGKGSYHTNADGSPKLLPPLHHDNPKAQYLKERLAKYLDSVQAENTRRRANDLPEIMPKVVVKSDFTTFGTDIVDGVFRDLMHPALGHPELRRWHEKTAGALNAGRFTGEATDREETKLGFRGNKKSYAENQGHLWATTVSPAGKEGVDFGNAHYMLHFDQNWNPQKMAQFTARVRRADSHEKAHASVDRANAVRVESLHMPGTIEDFIFNTQDRKMEDIKTVERNTRTAEEAPKYGDSAPGVGRSARSFTRGSKRKAGHKASQSVVVTANKKPKAPKTPKPSSNSDLVASGRAVASTQKAFKLIVLL